MKQGMTLCILMAATSAFAGDWGSGTNDPSNFDSHYEYRLTALPLKATLPKEKAPWASSFWPRQDGSINYRWNTENPTGYNLPYASKAELFKMSRQQLMELSPAEKFDLAQGHYHYPLSKDVAGGVKPTAKPWEGVCDGWSASAIQFTEPAPVDFTNPDGLVIPFGSSDVKAVMSYDVSINGSLDPVFVGSYCNPWLRRGCGDINPGAMHVILANQIGLKKESFVMDKDPGKQTWNQPVYGYEFEIVRETQVSGAALAYVVKGKIMYADDDPEEEQDYGKQFSWNPTVGTKDYLYATQEVEYVLELDRQGRIIGGSWISNVHPDLFWIATKKIEWTEDFKFIDKIYKPAF